MPQPDARAGLQRVASYRPAAPGILVEQVMVQCDLRRPATPMQRVRKRTHYVADCRTVVEVAKLVDLAQLEPR